MENESETPVESRDGAGTVTVDVVRNHDQEFTDFVRDAGAYLHRTAYLLCGDSHRSEELVQETFERVYRSWSKARVREPRAYARRVLVNLRIDGWRRYHREIFPGDDKIRLAPASDHADRYALRDELVRALSLLTTTQRRVIVLRHLLDLPEAQVARELGVPVGTVKAAGSRGLAKLRGLLREAADSFDDVRYDGDAMLAAGQGALRRRRARQASAGVAVALLLVIGVATRGSVTLPFVGPAVLPGGELLRMLLDEPRGPEEVPAGATNTVLPCPGDAPGPPPARPGTADDGLGVLRAPLVVDLGDAREATCHDILAGPGVSGDSDGGSSLPDPTGLTESGRFWQIAAEPGHDGGAGEQLYVHSGRYGAGALDTSALVLSIDGVSARPTLLTVGGDRAAWFEVARDRSDTRSARLRTFPLDGSPLTVSTFDGEPRSLVLTRDTVLWTTGPADDQALHSAVLSDPFPDGIGGERSGFAAEIQYRADLGAGVTALGSSDGEAVAARLSPAATGGRSRTTLRLFDGVVELLDDPDGSWDVGDGEPLVAYDTVGTDLLSFEHDASSMVSQVAVSPDLVAWVLAPAGGSGPGGLYVYDRRSGTDSVVRTSAGEITDLSASGGILLWNVEGEGVRASYLYRATPAASDDQGPDLARIPGVEVRADLAGVRIAWREDVGGGLSYLNHGSLVGRDQGSPSAP